MIVTTDKGKIEGYESDGLFRFEGIPYAAPPVGPLRLKPPAEHAPWDGIWDCTKYGNAAPQVAAQVFKVLQDSEKISEDCLYLNVYTNDMAAQNRPVLVFIHGGAFQKGSATYGYNPQAFTDENFVSVSINFRVGALGFLDFSSYLGEEYAQSGNNGLLDAIAALRWIRENIARFGGDPDNVTILGPSAGAKMVASLLLMEGAHGLFQRAIAISGGVQCIRDRGTAARVTDVFMKAAQLAKETAGELLTMPAEHFVNCQTELFAGLNLHTVGPVFDGINFKQDDALDIIRSGGAAKVPTMIGTNRDEMELFASAYKFYDLSEEMAVRLFGRNAPIVMRDYRRLDPDGAHFHEEFIELTTEYIYRSGNYETAKALSAAGTPVYYFRNDYDKQPLRACHSSENQFIMREYNKYPGEKGAEFYALADGICALFAEFIRHGVPKAPAMPDWPAFRENAPNMMVFDVVSRVIESPLPRVDPTMPGQVYVLS